MIRTLTVERWSSLRRWLPTDLYLWLKAILLTLIAIQTARLFWLVVTPAGPFGDWRPPAPKLLPENEQVTLLSTFNPFQRDAGVVAAAAPAINLVLFGVRAGGLGGGGAILGTPDGEQNSYSVGEEVAPGVTLSSVSFDHVVLDQGGRKQTLFMPGPEGQAAGAAAPAAAPAAPAARPFTLRPRLTGSAVTGAIIDAGANAALLQAAGLRPGDVVVAVNGARIASQIDVDQLQSSLTPGARLTLSVDRGGQTVAVALNVPGNQ